MNRAALIKMIHAGCRRLGWDEATRRAWMKLHSTQSSCALCRDTELSHLVDLLRDLGALDPTPKVSMPASESADRPTPEQWCYALDMSKKLGMSGAANDPALITFCRKVAKVNNPRFLDRDGIKALILGLEGWLKSRNKHHFSNEEKVR